MKGSAAILVLLFSALSSPALACSCIPPGSPAKEAARATAVFLGEVTEVRDSQPANTWWNRLRWRFGWGPDPDVFESSRPIRYRFRVIEAFKGNSSRNVDLTSSADGASCGVQFDRGRRYVVYAGGSPDALRAGRCSLTGPADDGKSGLPWLRAHKGQLAVIGSEDAERTATCPGRAG